MKNLGNMKGLEVWVWEWVLRKKRRECSRLLSQSLSLSLFFSTPNG